MAAAFRKAQKSVQRDHRERSQLGFRKQLGFLEKKKDYQIRAQNYHRKQNVLKALRQKALDKNPDEFYFRMTSNKLQDGVHIIKQSRDEATEEQLKIMRTQDIKYVETKRAMEAKKIERLKSELHFLDADGKSRNKHIFFCKSKKEVKEFNLAKHLNTLPELVGRVYNRPTIETLRKEKIKGATHPSALKKLARQRKHQYSLLKQHIEREKKMFVVAQKIQTRTDLMDKTKKVKVKKETVDSPAIYKFQFKRKR
ncbi:probable U3 small nucleolar RNA-associated protein 11 [Leucoraja erinacea]|uniref:probable U3 small nucleolar RNA-associated protein 11 n=1 Tax=Leucoraja erinaceus TaxID=7782 RepID=UPI00245380B7|nr:probable U3 small nucleolar RNA-associated protein 11 [Leucoraja erinacea]